MNKDTIRRKCNGSIDIDFYRARAAAERKAACRRLSDRIVKSAHAAFAEAALLAALWSIPGRPSVPHID